MEAWDDGPVQPQAKPSHGNGARERPDRPARAARHDDPSADDGQWAPPAAADEPADEAWAASGEEAWRSASWSEVPEQTDFGRVQEQHVDPEPLRVKEKPGRAIAQGLLALVGIGLFIGLVLVWRQSQDDVATLVAVVGALLLILLVEILLLRPIYDRLFRRVPSSLPLTPDEDNYIVGCPGCGTVFTVTEGELEEGGFSCHNCGRPGYIKDYQLNRGAIREETCRTCGNTYLEYLQHSECPVCHTYNPY